MDRSAERLSAVGVKPFRIMSKPRVSSAVSARGVNADEFSFPPGKIDQGCFRVIVVKLPVPERCA